MASYTIRFEARKDKINKQGESPISLIISVSGQRKRIPTDITIPYVNWSQSDQRAVFITKKQAKDLGVSSHKLEDEINDINSDLDEIKSDIETIVKRFKLDKIQFNVEKLAEEYRKTKIKEAPKAEPSNFLFDFMDNYITVNEPTRAKNSMSVYKSLKNHLKGYQDKKKKKVKFENINYDFFLSFQAYL
ncbi:MAG: phage integrase SAM-like domain-containing protein, partial [Cyclobacteriaceae bacterium]|nr:phage integrase SAM-like domain-containing protein [Cyclobacteriaceae bacterium]